MHKLITFRTIKAICDRWYSTTGYENKKYLVGCTDIESHNDECCAKNCPVWKRLNEMPDKIIDGKPYWNIGGLRIGRKHRKERSGDESPYNKTAMGMGDI